MKAKGRLILKTAVVAAMSLLVLTACSSNAGTKTQETAALKSENNSKSAQADTDLVIPVSDISEKVSYYPVEADGTKMEVLAVKAPDGTIRTAFNTCQVCYDSGRGYYKQDGNELVCQNCGNRFPMSRVEVEAGGCNPWPIFDQNKTVTDESITISSDFLKESKQIFANWKKTY
ncbi:Fe-S-containing protein [Lacrimispora defluvii]|uniref:DUF2318 domain-containing protein n=1 Tax=Lacrimispora defluvii TaxID=2719233 RepID=A0ABX1VY08_9FIRM|nr:DUF2318 domain-containing protein [Lacrimispora defluvii]NNJ32737.1 DUF2318 domain-containing protein [Lacrimispora defluvii]